jgi:hypothetical protein
MVSPLNMTYHAPPNSKLSGPSDSPLNARPGTQFQSAVHVPSGAASEGATVLEDRSDVTVVADLMAETGERDDDPSLAAPGESVMIDLADDDDAPPAGVTISTVTDAVQGEDPVDDADTRLLGPWNKKPPPRS